MSQIALPLEMQGSNEPSKIVVGAANAHIVEAVRDSANWPYRTAVLTGPKRSGKSLLGRWAQSQDIAVIDNADGKDETEIFHRWNAAQASDMPLLLISNSQPWDISLPDLRSRLGGSLQLEIGALDDDMAAQMLGALAAQYGLSLADGAAEYLVPRTTRSFAALERLIKQIDRISLERQAAPTMSIWRAALEATQGPEQHGLI